MTKILIVEDNDMNLDMLSRRLLRKGFEIISARDGQAGVDQAKSELPDIILMDMSLPVLDGWQATRAIKSDAVTTVIPVIALTAHAMDSDRKNALDAGCDAFHTKPIDLPGLLDQINQLIPKLSV
ncbi:MAG: response regulator [Sulfitobacter sp.]